MIDWERLSGRPEAAALPDALEAPAALSSSSFHVTADWNGWGMEVMQEEEEETVGSGRTSKLSCVAHLLRAGGEFQILRNRDVEQTLYPLEETAGSDNASAVGGPDDDDDGRTWWLNGR